MTSDACAALAAAVDREGWAVQDDFLSAPEVEALSAEVLRFWETGDFRPAGVGYGESLRVRPEIRRDHVHWIAPESATAAQRHYLALMEALRRALNERMYLGLFEFEGHLALYPPGAFYKTHLDQFHGVEARILSCVVYLNADWAPAHGGELRLYLQHADTPPFVDIVPRAGTLVCFLSGRFHHEVRPTTQPRLSLTGWFRRRDA